MGDCPASAFFKYNTNGRDCVDPKRHCAAVREAIFYSEIDAGCDHPIGPRCYDIGGNFDAGEVYLILEDITDSYILVDKADTPSPYGGWASFETAPFDRFIETAKRLAKFQARWWDHPRIKQADLSSGTGDMLSTAMTSTVAFVERTLTPQWETNVFDGLKKRGEPDPESARETIRRVIQTWPAIYRERKTRGNLSLMHVDLHLRNVLFHAQTGDPLVIDWEGLTTGIGIIDIAHLAATSMLSPAYLDRLDDLLVPAYHEALVEAGVTGYSLDECQADYRLAWVALIPQAWSGDPFTRSVLHQFERHRCIELVP